MDLAETTQNKVGMTDAGKPDSLFEKNYIILRRQENRLYSDDEVALLPDISTNHIHYKEWQIRKQSCEKLISALNKKHKPLTILEVGCGNGWFSKKLSKIPNSTVTGLDINFTELEQAQKVFSDCQNLYFKYGDLRSGILNEWKFDVIVFAASIQYFPLLPEILNCAYSHLNQNGEIHIIDTPFYAENELAAARKRSAEYYSQSGLQAMEQYYFHHSLQQLQPFTPRLVYNPGLLRNRLLKNKSPFPWICIEKDNK
jgi:ubiquinone/menaquinone biosynthesis C-methylase UbiE